MTIRQVLPRDAIPSVDDPTFVDEYDGPSEDEVIVMTHREGAGADGDGFARAYPVRYLHFHEIVNDRLGEMPVAVTWCPLCGSAVVYDRRVPAHGIPGNDEADGTDGVTDTLEFGVSGKLADDDLVMYDRETGSEWKQSLGRCISGALEGESLDVLPASLTTWGSFRETYPDGVVLAAPGGDSEAASDTDDPAPIDYDAAPYDAYFEMEGFGLDAHRGTGGRDWGRDDLDPKAVVLGIESGGESGDESGGEALGFPLPVVERAGGVVTATVGDIDVVVFATDAGIHAFERPDGDGDVEFQSREERSEANGDREFLGDGTVWDGVTGESADGRQLVRLPARRLFAFAWQDDHGAEAFYGLDG